MDFEQINYAVANGIATIMLDRPDKLNAFTARMLDELLDAFDRVDADELNRIGSFTESAPPLVPGRVNVSFVEVRGAGELFVQTFERGVGPTNACGSAMAASKLS